MLLMVSAVNDRQEQVLLHFEIGADGAVGLRVTSPEDPSQPGEGFVIPPSESAQLFPALNAALEAGGGGDDDGEEEEEEEEDDAEATAPAPAARGKGPGGPGKKA